jgi:hypothetical protein
MNKRETPPGEYPAARKGRSWRFSAFDRVGPLAALVLSRNHVEAQLLPDSARKEAADAVGLPVGCLHQALKRRAFRPLQQIQDLLRLAPGAGSGYLSAVLGRFLWRAGLLGRLALLRRNVGATRASVGLLGGFRLPARRVAWAVPVSSVIDVVIFYSPLAVITAVRTSITPTCSKSKAIVH